MMQDEERGMPAELCRYDPRRWCKDPSNTLEAGYFGILEYRMARKMWFIIEKGLPEPLARAAAIDSAQFGPSWAVPRGS